MEQLAKKEEDTIDAKVISSPHDLVGMVEEGKAVRKTEVGYHTAVSVQIPRDLDSVVANVEKEAVYGGDNFYYRWPVKTKKGKKIIEGGSIGLALAIAREWGNCAIPTEVETQGRHWIFKASFVDLERGFTISRTFRANIPMSSPGGYDLDRWQDMQFQKGQSQAMRNVIFNGVPTWLRTKAIEVAKEAALKKITKGGIDKNRNEAIKFFEGYGVTTEQIRDTMGKNLNNFTPDDIAVLRNLAVQVKNGDVSVEEIFNGKKEEKKVTPPSNKQVKSKKEEKPETKKKESPEGQSVECPALDDAKVDVKHCNTKCEDREGCPSWETEEGAVDKSEKEASLL